MERRLGRGLGALLSSEPSEAPQTELKIASIRPNPFQPRTTFDEEGLEELKASIQNHGVLQPIVVRATAREAGGRAYELISGERRWRASKLAGRDSIPAVVRVDVSDEDMLELALVENVQRRDLDPIERGRGYRQLMDALKLTQEQVAQRVGLKRSTVANHLRLLELPERVQEALGRGWLSMGHARALLGLPDDGAREEMMASVIRGDLSVRETEKRVRDRGTVQPARKADGEKGTAESSSGREPWMTEVETRLRESLGTKVRVQHGPEARGQILVEYYDLDGLNGLLERLAPRRTL